MRRSRWMLAAAGLLALPAMGQDAAQPEPPKNATVIHTRDGGVTEVLQSIVVPPKAGAPFTLTLETEWVKQLYDGGTTTLVPKNDHRVHSVQTMIQIHDPETHTRYDCFLREKTRLCELLNYTNTTSNVYKPMSPATGPLPGEQGSAIHEDLGKRLIDGVETEGTHDILIYNPGTFGNDRKMTVENEFWWSAQLGLNLLSIKNDPRIGKQTFTVVEVTQGDPEPSLFQVPAGFEIVDRRQTGLP